MGSECSGAMHHDVIGSAPGGTVMLWVSEFQQNSSTGSPSDEADKERPCLEFPMSILQFA
jgi:hypothetical protein